MNDYKNEEVTLIELVQEFTKSSKTKFFEPIH